MKDEAKELPDVQMLTIAEVADYLRLSRQKVYTMAKTGAIPAVTFGRAVRIPRAKFIKWLEERDAS